jgi:RNA polymerase sigma-32 factor
MSQGFDLSSAQSNSSLEMYLETLDNLPPLSKEQEQQLARKFREESDLEAAKQLVLGHLRFVVKIARGYRGYGLPLGDLIQEGNIGLMKAVKRFDPEIGVRLISFAIHWIKSEIHEFIIKNWRIVKIATTKAQRKLFFNLRSKKTSVGWMENKQIARLAHQLNVEEKDVKTMEQRLSANDLAFEAEPENDITAFSPASYLEDNRFEPAANLERLESKKNRDTALRRAMGQLDKRSRDIVESRWLKEPKDTLQDLAKRYEVSAERIRQLEKKAFDGIRCALKSEKHSF